MCLAQFVSQQTSGSLKLPVINPSRLGGLYLYFFNCLMARKNSEQEGLPLPLAGWPFSEGVPSSVASRQTLPSSLPSCHVLLLLPHCPSSIHRGSAEPQASFKTRQEQKSSCEPLPPNLSLSSCCLLCASFGPVWVKDSTPTVEGCWAQVKLEKSERASKKACPGVQTIPLRLQVSL